MGDVFKYPENSTTTLGAKSPNVKVLTKNDLEKVPTTQLPITFGKEFTTLTKIDNSNSKSAEGVETESDSD